MRVFKGHISQVAAASFAFGIAAVASWPGTPTPSGYVEAPSSRTFMSAVPTIPFFHAYVSQAKRIQATPDLRPAEDRSRTHEDPATVYLWVTDKKTGAVVSSGAGTIIAGTHDTHRVLTAFHVLDKRRDPENLAVTAFSSTGRAIATMAYADAAVSPDQWPRMRNVRDPQGAAGDQAVLAVETLMGGETTASWNARAVELAPFQPETFLVLAPAATDATLSPGVSGGSVRNSAGHVVGTMVMSSGTHPDTPEARPQNLSLVRAAEAHFGLSYVSGRDDVTNAVANAVAIAVPVIHPRVLDALGAQTKPTQVLEAFKAEVFGFPDGYALKTEVHASRLGNARVEPYFTQESLIP